MQGLHGREPGGGERANIEDEGSDARGEVGELLNGMEHGGAGASREECVGNDVHGDEVGDDWIRGDWERSLERRCHAFEPHWF